MADQKLSKKEILEKQRQAALAKRGKAAPVTDDNKKEESNSSNETQAGDSKEQAPGVKPINGVAMVDDKGEVKS